MLPENAIEVINISKKFKVYYDKGTTLKEKVLFEKRRKYEERIVLNDISFQVRKGEAIGLIGHNGCGKSTTLKLLTRIMYPDSGSIEIIGRVSSLIELGAGFHPDMTGRENIYINAAIFGLTRREIDARLQEIIDFSELQEFIDNPVRTYSSGMYMRLAFSVAINVDAEVLLIDEILGVGDANFQVKCFNKLKEIKEKGTTIVIVSHSLNQIEQICERSLWLQDGKIQEDGLPEVIHEHYLNYMSRKTNSEYKKDENIDKTNYMEFEYYDHVISLGDSCQTAFQLSRLGLRKASYPFDWLFTINTDSIIMALNSEFTEWLQKENLIEEKSRIPEHLKIIDKKYGVTHQHIFPAEKAWEDSYEEVKRIVDRRILRMLNLKNKKLLFVRVTTEIDKIKQLEEILVKAFGENIRLMILVPSNEFEIKKIRNSFKYTDIYEIYQETEIELANWQGYDDHYNMLFQRVRLFEDIIDLKCNKIFLNFWPWEENSKKKVFRWTKAFSTIDLRKFVNSKCVITLYSPINNRIRIYDASQTLLEELDIDNVAEVELLVNYETRFLTFAIENIWTPKEKFMLDDDRKLGVKLEKIHIVKIEGNNI